MADKKGRIAVVSRGPSAREGGRTYSRGRNSSRSEPPAQEGNRSFEDALALALRDRGHRVLIVPHIYYLRPEEAAARRLASLGREIGAAASWLYPRAAEWTLRFLIAQADPSGTGTGGTFFDMADFRSAAECAAAMCAALGRSPSGAAGGIEEIGGDPRDRWYPVIDGSRCAACGKCLEFCLFGVYGRGDGTVRVERPDSCKPGCPACARVCPERAIMFPECPDSIIAGAGDRDAVSGAAAGSKSRHPAAGVRRPAERTARGMDGAGRRHDGGPVKTERRRGKTGKAGTGRRGDFDDLIRKLDELDV
ncbi:MAG: ferredoxin family protein [Planctomycetota bacterium]|nr:ferredoxin family protein [Planctomycetota bacterium]